MVAPTSIQEVSFLTKMDEFGLFWSAAERRSADMGCDLKAGGRGIWPRHFEEQASDTGFLFSRGFDRGRAGAEPLSWQAGSETGHHLIERTGQTYKTRAGCHL
ncbi:hypothetical protein PhaeoP23_03919 (plasmid) [Phaeobacter piscinae]|uniref:Uncharacterized protein n=1 Tax=Phaeobacter piscinae TaxID=1580596 RepID=A0ABM6PJT4_9RHOB|nr:hypothetical protein PhaeoP36_03997 [Phaeobacter piscinae]ATG41920.1 hypothetical protein PhaeoP14_03888 [Phaeobacter piscinae]AUQ88593.1 hypothetical protein PhaeoP42_03998 [Phaeobacter piscinae]AUR26398.1 hypothetical protein PhaeoP23_03919 [Phaeobacter piscinae]UTS82965.1 hypothetical protein OL67_004075 [Phaeobacter piscinae]